MYPNTTRSLAALALLLSVSAHSAEFLWQGTRSADWGDGQNWNDPADRVPSSSDNVVFTDIAASLFDIDLNGNRTVRRASFEGADDFTLSGNSLSLGNGDLSTSGSGSHTINSNVQLLGGGLWDIGAGTGLNVAGQLSGAFGLAKQGDGALTLGGANTHTGDTQINAGTIILNNAQALQNSTLSINLDNGLNINGLNATLGGLSGSGRLDLGIQALAVGSNNANTTFSGVLRSDSTNTTSTFTKNGTGILTLTGSFLDTGNININDGSVIMDGGNFNTTFHPQGKTSTIAASGSVTLRNGGLFRNFSDQDIHGNLTIESFGSFSSEQLQTFGANATITVQSGGMLRADQQELATGGGNLSYQVNNADVRADSIAFGDLAGSGTATMTVDAHGSVDVRDDTTFRTSNSTLTVDQATYTTGTLTNDAGIIATISLSDRDASTSALTVGTNNGSSIFDGLIQDAASGSGSLRKTGTGSLTLTNANSFSGTTTVDGGMIILGHKGALQNSTVSIDVDNGLNVNGHDAVLGGLSGSGDLDIDSQALSVGISTNMLYSGDLTGTIESRLHKLNTGTLTLTGSGGVGYLSVSQGTLVIDSGQYETLKTRNSAISSALTVRNNGSIDFAGRVDLNRDLLIENSAAFNSTVLLIQGDAATVTVQSGGTLSTSGLQELAYMGGNVTYQVSNAGSSVFAGGINFSNGGVGIGTMTVDDQAQVNVTNASTFNNSVSSLTVDQATYSTGTLTNDTGIIATISLSDRDASSPALTVGTNNGSSTFDGLIQDAASGAGSVRKTGTGSLTLTNANTYSGTTQIDGGMVTLGHDNALQNSTVSVNVDDGLNINGHDVMLGGLGGSGSLNIGDQNVTLGNNDTDVLYAGNLTGASISSTLTKTGTATQTLTGTASGIGSLIVNQGAVVVDAGGDYNITSGSVFGIGTAMTVRNGGQFNDAGTVDALGTLTIETAGMFGSDKLRSFEDGAVITVHNGGTLSTDRTQTIGASDAHVVYQVSNAGSSVSAKKIVLTSGDSGSTVMTVDDGAQVTVEQGTKFTGANSSLIVDQATYSTGSLENSPGIIGIISLSDIDANTPALTVGTNGGSTTFDGLIQDASSGAGSLRKTRSGALTLTNENTYSGTTMIDNGSIILGHANALQNSTVSINVDNGLNINGHDAVLGGLAGSGALNIGVQSVTLDNNGSDTVYSGTLSGSAGSKIGKTGAGTLLLSGTGSGIDSIGLQQGTVIIDGGDYTLGDVTSGFFPGASMTVRNSGAIAFGGLVNMRGSLTVESDGSFNANQLRSFDDNASITVQSGGTLSTTTSQSLAALGGSIDYRVNNTGSSVAAQNITFGKDLTEGVVTMTVADQGQVTVADNTRFFNALSSLTVDQGSFSTGTLSHDAGAAATISLSDFDANSPALTIGTNGGSSSFDGLIQDAASGAGSLRKTGSGTLNLSNANTFSGGIRGDDGTLSLAHSSAAGSGIMTLAGITLDYGDGIAVANDIELTGNSIFHVETGSAGQSGFVTETTGSFGITKTGNGALLLSGIHNAQSYSGTTQIDAGRLVLGDRNTLEHSTVSINVDDGLDMTGQWASLGGLEGSGDLDIATQRLFFGSNDADTLYSGDLIGSTGSAVVKRGTGTMTLTGSGDGIDWIAVEAGELVIDGADYTARGTRLSVGRDGSLTVRNSGMLDVGAGADAEIQGDVLVESSAIFRAENFITPARQANITVQSGGTLITSGTQQLSGGDGDFLDYRVSNAGSSVSADSIIFGDSRGFFVATMVVEDQAQVEVSNETRLRNSASSLTVDQASYSTGILSNDVGAMATISLSSIDANTAALTIGSNDGDSLFDGLIEDAAGGSGSLRKVGGGSLTLNGANSYSGGTVIDGGSLLTTNTSGSATGSGGITINSGLLGGNGFINGTVNVNAGGIVSPGQSPGELTVDAITFASDALFEVEIGGLIAGSEYDRLNVLGDALLDGILDLSFIDLGSGTFAPQAGDSFDILSADQIVGEFTQLMLADLDADLGWKIDYLTDAIGSTDLLRLSVFDTGPSGVPLPPSLWLFALALLQLGSITSRHRRRV